MAAWPSDDNIDFPIWIARALSNPNLNPKHLIMY